jgi:hypothetical protein
VSGDYFAWRGGIPRSHQEQRNGSVQCVTQEYGLGESIDPQLVEIEMVSNIETISMFLDVLQFFHDWHCLIAARVRV